MQLSFCLVTVGILTLKDGSLIIVNVYWSETHYDSWRTQPKSISTGHHTDRNVTLRPDGSPRMQTAVLPQRPRRWGLGFFFVGWFLKSSVRSVLVSMRKQVELGGSTLHQHKGCNSAETTYMQILKEPARSSPALHRPYLPSENEALYSTAVQAKSSIEHFVFNVILCS